MPQDVILSQVALQTANERITEAEAAILKQLSQAESVDVVVPETMSREDFRATLSAVCKSWVRAALRQQMLLPALGKLMVLAKAHPELWQDREDQPYEDFVAMIGDKFGVGRETCFAAKRLVTRWAEHLALTDWRQIGRNNLELINKTVPRGDERKPEAQALIAMAKHSTTAALAEHIEGKGLLEEGESRGGVIRITCSQTVYRMWLRFVQDDLVRAYCESDKPDLILRRCMEECQNEWIIRMKEALEHGNGNGNGNQQ
jgi:hypothetical protein